MAAVRRGVQRRLGVGVLALAAAAAGCIGDREVPTPTGAACPSPDPGTLTWASFGQAFMTRYCTMCHDSTLPRAQRNGAPIYHDFDTLRGVLQVVDHVDQYAGSGPDAHNTIMPTARCPAVPGGPLAQACLQPTDQERTDLSVWLACERARPPEVDAGAGPDAGPDAM